MELPLVSIIIPTFNQEEFVARAIEGALAQKYSNLEIIVADDNSSDKTSEIIKPYLDTVRIKLFENKPRLGRVANYRKCLYDYAQGDFAIVCDGDDYFENPNFISDAIEKIGRLSSFESIAFFQGGHRMLFESSGNIRTCIPSIESENHLYKPYEYLFNFNNINHFSHLATLYNRGKALESEFYTENILSTDMDSILRLSLKGDVILSKSIAGVWFQHGTNASGTASVEKLVENLKWIENVKQFAYNIGEQKCNIKRWASRTKSAELASLLYYKGLKLKNEGNFKAVFMLFIKILNENPCILFRPVFIKKSIDLIIK